MYRTFSTTAKRDSLAYCAVGALTSAEGAELPSPAKMYVSLIFQRKTKIAVSVYSKLILYSMINSNTDGGFVIIVMVVVVSVLV